MMRSLVSVMIVTAVGTLGGALGGLAGVVMDRFRGLGLGPEEFWHTDPEIVWAWGIIVGAATGILTGLAARARWLPRPVNHRDTSSDSN